MTPPDLRLDAEQLTFGHPGREVGRDANLALRSGEIFCLLGPNGCGKTTLFKTLLGLIPPQGGRVLLGGRDLRTLSRREVAHLLAYVPQSQPAPFAFTTEEVVLMGRTAHRSAFSPPSREDRRIAREALALLGVADLADRDMTKLSGGQRQLVTIARAIAQQSPIVVLDEPTASLDFGNQARVLTQIRRLADQGVGIVLSTHDPDHAFALASRVALMDAGDIVAVGPAREVLTEGRLMSVYGVPVRVETLTGGQTICAPDFRPLQGSGPKVV